MPEYQAFLSGENLITFWHYVKWLLFLVAPGVLIWVSIDAVNMLVTVIKGAFKKEKKNSTKDDDYDVYHY